MFAHPLWSVLLLAAPIAVYWLVIRPRLQAKLTELYADGGWLHWIGSLLYAFRTFVISTFGVVLVALPDLLVLIPTLDLSFLPRPWPMYVSIATSVVVTLMKAYETKPGENQ